MNIDITDRGAVPGGKVLCTAEIQRAIDDCNASGGGRVTVPPGVFLTGTIWLRDNVELHLGHGSVLKASADMNDYNALDAYPQNYGCDAEMWVGKHLIIALMRRPARRLLVPERLMEAEMPFTASLTYVRDITGRMVLRLRKTRRLCVRDSSYALSSATM